MPPGGSEAEMSAATAPASASVAASNSEFRTCVSRIHCRGSGSVGPEACTCMNVSAPHTVRSIALTRFPRAPAALDRVFSRGSWRQPIKAGIAGCSEGYSAALCHQQRISHIGLCSSAATSRVGQGIIGLQTQTARQRSRVELVNGTGTRSHACCLSAAGTCERQRCRGQSTRTCAYCRRRQRRTCPALSVSEPLQACGVGGSRAQSRGLRRFCFSVSGAGFGPHHCIKQAVVRQCFVEKVGITTHVACRDCN